MRYIYHGIPKNMVGDTLYPMNKLGDVSPELYQVYKAGYEGREELLNRQIPYLDCLWNDVLHCTPVHPQLIADALRTAGVHDNPIKDLQFFEIDTYDENIIDIDKAVIFYRNTADNISFTPAIEVDLDSVDFIPKLTLEYYDQVAKTSEALFPYHGIPHFLYAGSIDTKNLKRIAITNP